LTNRRQAHKSRYQTLARAGQLQRARMRAEALRSVRWVVRPTSLRSRGKHCEAGSERARRPVSRAGRRGLRSGAGGARAAGHPSGDLSRAAAAQIARRCSPAAGGRGRGRDRRGCRAEPDRRLPARDRLGAAGARPAGEPQAGAARDARAQPDPASHARAAPTPARVLPGRAARSALASGHDERVGRRAWVVLPERDHRLLHSRDRRLGFDRPLPRRGGDRGDRTGHRRAGHPIRGAQARDRQRLRVRKWGQPQPGRTFMPKVSRRSR
jgi:hypothetical protein